MKLIKIILIIHQLYAHRILLPFLFTSLLSGRRKNKQLKLKVTLQLQSKFIETINFTKNVKYLMEIMLDELLEINI